MGVRAIEFFDMQKSKKTKIILTIVIIVFLAGCRSPAIKKVKQGDIIFQISQSSQSQAIQLATNSKYSHMGIIIFLEGQPYVYEASQVVMFTPLKDWIARGKRKHYVIKRLKESEEILTPEKILKIEKIALEYKDKPYDIHFEWSDNKIYCSELVWKIYKRAIGIEIGELQKLKDFDLENDIVKKKLKERFGTKIPYEEIVISPAVMFNSDLLIKIEEG